MAIKGSSKSLRFSPDIYIYDNVLIIVDGSELRLKISEAKDESYEADNITPGKYNGKIVYAQQWAKILHIEIYSVKDK